MEHSNGYISSTETAEILGIKPKSVGFLARQGKLPALKVANRWIISRQAINDFSRTYQPRVGRPRTKRKYTKRGETWKTK